jgi:uncharacterized membrane protein
MTVDEGGTMANHMTSIEIEQPLSTVYNQWTQFESFPQFMEGVESVRQIDDRSTHWVVDVGGVRREFDAVIEEQVPDQRIAWRSVDEPKQAGIVTFQPLAAGTTRVSLMLDFEPVGVTEKVGDSLGFVQRRVEGDLARFKDFLEDRGTTTGAWRGAV